MKGDTASLSLEDVAGIAAKLGVKPEEVVEMETRFAGGEVAIDRSHDDDDDRAAPIDWLADDSAEPVEVLEAAEAERLHDEGLRSALASLDDRSRAIVQRRWLVEENPATLHELAAEYGVSAERIRQIEVKAMQKMKLALSA